MKQIIIKIIVLNMTSVMIFIYTMNDIFIFYKCISYCKFLPATINIFSILFILRPRLNFKHPVLDFTIAFPP